MFLASPFICVCIVSDSVWQQMPLLATKVAHFLKWHLCVPKVAVVIKLGLAAL